MVFHHRSNSMEISISSHGNSNEVISAKFSTWHEGCAVLASVNICCDPMIRTLIVAKWIFHPIRTVSENRLRNWLHLDKPGLLGQQPNVVEHGSWSWGNYIIGNPFKIFHKTRSAARFRDVPSATLNAHITPSDKVLHNHWKLEEFWRKKLHFSQHYQDINKHGDDQVRYTLRGRPALKGLMSNLAKSRLFILFPQLSNHFGGLQRERQTCCRPPFKISICLDNYKGTYGWKDFHEIWI